MSALGRGKSGLPESVRTKIEGRRGAPGDVRVLAFGDSLTEGFTDGGRTFAPYTRRLECLLLEKVQAGEDSCGGGQGKGKKVVVDNRGKSGEFSMTMVNRIRKVLGEADRAGIRYDYVILLGGTNDLGTTQTAEDIQDNLRSMYASVLGGLAVEDDPTEAALPGDGVTGVTSSTRLVVMTVPEAKSTFGPGYQRKRTTVNDFIRAFAAERSDRVVLFDLERTIPYSSLTDEQKVEYLPLWDDTLHFSVAGYERIAEHLAAKMAPFVE